MKRILVIVLLILSAQAVHAQSFSVTFGLRLEAVPNALGGDKDVAVVYPLPGLELGVLTRLDNVTIGARLSFAYLILFWHGQADLYVGYTLPEGTMLYAGLGYGFNTFAFEGGDNEDIHGLLGARLAGGFFVEATPGIGYGRICERYRPSEVYETRLCEQYRNVQVLIVGINLGWVWVLG